MEDVTLAIGSPVRRSDSIASLAAALAKAQGEIEGASKDKTNPHFKSSYADLASVWGACRAPLSKNSLAVLQPAFADGPCVTVTTILAHSSGEFIEVDLTMTAQQNTPQGIGSCMTYARRYALSSLVGIAPEDDDGNAASQGNGNGQSNASSQGNANGQTVAKPSNGKPPVLAAPAGFDNWLSDLEIVATNGTAALEDAWKKSQPYFRKHLTDTDKGRWESLKARAATKATAVLA